MKRVLVTGAAGFVGRHMITYLLGLGYDVSGCDVRQGTSPINTFIRRDALDVFHGHVPELNRRYDLVVHAAAYSPHREAIDTQPRSLIKNAQLDAALFDWAVRTQQERVLYLSSCAVLDEQPDGYGQVKLAGE